MESVCFSVVFTLKSVECFLLERFAELNQIKISLAKTGEVKVSGRKKAAAKPVEVIARKAIDSVPYFTALFQAAREQPDVVPLDAIRSAILANPTEAIITLLKTRLFKPKEVALLVGYNTDNKDQRAEWRKLYNEVKWHFMCQVASEFVEARVPASYKMPYQSEYGEIQVGLGPEVRKKCLRWLFRSQVFDEYTPGNTDLKAQHTVSVVFRSRTRGIKAQVPAEIYPWAWAANEKKAISEWIGYGKECRREFAKVFRVRDTGDRQSMSMLQASASRVIAHLIPKK